jgi:hypothetical protein
LGAFVGALGGLWIGLLGRVFFGPLPVSGHVILLWAVGGAVVGFVFGIVAPKVTTIVCFPFSTFGSGAGS